MQDMQIYNLVKRDAELKNPHTAHFNITTVFKLQKGQKPHKCGIYHISVSVSHIWHNAPNLGIADPVNYVKPGAKFQQIMRFKSWGEYQLWIMTYIQVTSEQDQKWTFLLRADICPLELISRTFLTFVNKYNLYNYLCCQIINKIIFVYGETAYFFSLHKQKLRTVFFFIVFYTLQNQGLRLVILVARQQNGLSIWE